MSAIALRVGPVSARVERRAAAACTGLAVAVVCVAFVALCRGASWDSPGRVLSALVGGEGAVVVQQWRLPRVVAAVAFGAALGLAGAVFQSITRNALGSPDVIGLDSGAYAGALIVITVLTPTASNLSIGAVIGGLSTAAAIYVLSLKSGFSGLRLIVIGIAVNAMLTAFNSWLILRSELEIALAASFWSAGSLNGVGWDDISLALVVLGALVALMAGLWRPMAQIGLGDDLAVTSGVALGWARLLLILAAVGCTSTVTAVAGPIVFIALAAPQIGRRLAGVAGVALLPAALTGALLLVAADLLAQLLLAPQSLPVGVVTTVIGGGYLLWLLVREVGRT